MSRFVTFFIVIYVSLMCLPNVKGSASECRRPYDTDRSNVKRGVVSTLSNSFDHSQDILASGSSKMTSDTETLAAITLFSLRYISPQAKHNIQMSPKHFTGKTGPLDAKIQNRQMEFTGKDNIPCVACRLDCMEAVPEYGSIFKECENRFFYYGCQKIAPCNNMSDGRVIMETAIGICLERNKCLLVDSLKDLKETKVRVHRRRRIHYTPNINDIKKGILARVGNHLEKHYGYSRRRRFGKVDYQVRKGLGRGKR